MEFGWSPEILAMHDQVLTFARAKLNHDLVARDRGGHRGLTAQGRAAHARGRSIAL